MAERKQGKLTFKHKLGYAFGDWGGCMTFAIMGAFLTPYYTEVARLSPAAVAAMFLLIRIWDAINDPLIGILMDKLYARSNHPKGKFRPYLLRSAPMVAIAAILMFSIPNQLSMGMKLVWAYVTYLLYEISYTFFNVPYGSLLSAMAKIETERSQLSSARGFGAIIGNLLPMMIFPAIIASTTFNPQHSYQIGVLICAAIGLVISILSYKLTEERYTVTPAKNDEKVKVTDILLVFRKNRPFVAISIAATAATIQQTVVGALGVYYFRENLNALALMGISTFVGMGLSVVALAIIPKFVKKYGTEKTVLTSLLIGVGFMTSLFLFPDNIWIYIPLNGLGTTFLGIPILLQWGMVGEVIDYNEYIVGKRSEGSIYGTFNLTRRFGQAIGSSMGAALVGIVGIVPNTVQTAETLNGIRAFTFGTPLVCGIIAFIALRFIWNIDAETRAKMAAVFTKKEEQRAATGN